MKYLSYLLLILILAACQKEELKIVEGQEEESFVRDSQLKNLLVSVVAHDGSFDDVMDKSSCFSIDFPYICSYNGHAYPVDSAEDLAPFDAEDNLVPRFPITITYANHQKETIPDIDTFLKLINRCSNGELYNDAIGCVDIMYPVSVALYYPDSSDFETITFTHDKQTFETIFDFDENIIANINYPIEIKLENDVVLTITSNDILKSQILDIIPFCE